MTSSNELRVDFDLGETAMIELMREHVGNARHAKKVVVSAVREIVSEQPERLAIEIGETSLTISYPGALVDSLDQLREQVLVGHPICVKGAAPCGSFRVDSKSLSLLGETRWEIGRFSVELERCVSGYGFVCIEHATELFAGTRITMGGEYCILTKSDFTALKKLLSESFPITSLDITLNGERIGEHPDSVIWNIVEPTYRVRWNWKGPLQIIGDETLIKTIPRKVAGVGGTIVINEKLRLTPDRSEIAVRTKPVEEIEGRFGITIAPQ